MEKEDIVVYDNLSFHYSINVEYHYNMGFAHASYNGRILSTVSLNRLYEPTTDRDDDWDFFNIKLSEWKEEAWEMLRRSCINHFNNQ